MDFQSTSSAPRQLCLGQDVTSTFTAWAMWLYIFSFNTRVCEYYLIITFLLITRYDIPSIFKELNLRKLTIPSIREDIVCDDVCIQLGAKIQQMRMSVSSWKQRHSKWWCLCPVECEDTDAASGTSAIRFSTLEPNSHHLDNERSTHFTVAVLCDGFHLPPWDFPCWNLQTVLKKKRNGVQTEFGVLALWLLDPSLFLGNSNSKQCPSNCLC